MPKWYGGSALNPDEIIPKEMQWKIQWERLRRWYNRANEIKVKSDEERLTAYDIDILIAFFQNCYHLRDWIQNSRPELLSQLSSLFKNHFEMAACRDVCNGFKHKVIDKNPLDAEFNLYREYDHFKAEAEPFKNPELYRIAFADGKGIRKHDIFDLIDRCYQIWNQFIGENNL